MQRMSEPQMVEAFTRSKTSPWPGDGTGTVRNSTVEFPGRYAAVMVAFISFFPAALFTRPTCAQPVLRRRYLSMNVPQVFPGLAVLPEKHLAFNQAAVAVDSRNLPHLFVAQRIARYALKIGAIVVDRKWNRRLPALHRPLGADHRGMNPMPPGNLHDHWIFRRRGVLRRSIAFGPARRTNGTITDGLNVMVDDKLKKFRLLEMRMQLHFVHGGLDARIPQHQLQLGDG